MECPKCKLENPEEAMRCDCGYHFIEDPELNSNHEETYVYDDSDEEFKDSEKKEKINNRLKAKFFYGYGVFFRTIIYGIILWYIYGKIVVVKDIPIAQLTFGEVVESFFMVIFSVFVLFYFFKYPDREFFSSLWGGGGFFLTCILFLVGLGYAAYALKNETAQYILGLLILVAIVWGGILNILDERKKFKEKKKTI